MGDDAHQVTVYFDDVDKEETVSDNEIYDVTIEFEKLSDFKDDDEVIEEFPDATSATVIGDGKFRVKYVIAAKRPAGAFRATADYVEARIGISVVGPINVLRGEVTQYGDEEIHEF